MSSRNRNAIIITFLALSVLGVVFNRPEPSSLNPVCLIQSREQLKTRQLQTSFDNMKNQFTPGYKFRNLGDDGELRIDCRAGKIFKTQTKTNLAVNGNAFFCLAGDHGRKIYTRDGRFQFFEGTLRHRDDRAVLGYPLDSLGNICGEEAPIELSVDPENKLYCGQYTDFKIDNAGTLYGVMSLVDPVTGQQVVSSTPLFAVLLVGFEAPGHLNPLDATLFEATQACGEPFFGVAGQRELGEIKAGCLELSNVDYMEEGLRIGQIKQEKENLNQGTLYIRAKFNSETFRILSSKNVAVNHGEGLTSLEGHSRQHLFLALNSALEAAEDPREQDLLLRAMETLEPRLVQTR